MTKFESAMRLKFLIPAPDKVAKAPINIAEFNKVPASNVEGNKDRDG